MNTARVMTLVLFAMAGKIAADSTNGSGTIWLVPDSLIASQTNVVFQKDLSDGRQVVVREHLVKHFSSGLWSGVATNGPLVYSSGSVTNGLLRYEMVAGSGTSRTDRIWAIERDVNGPISAGQANTYAIWCRCFVYDVETAKDKIAILYSVGSSVRIDLIAKYEGIGYSNRTYEASGKDPEVPFAANPELAWSANGRILALRFPRSLIKAWPNDLEVRDYFLAYIDVETGENETAGCTFPYWQDVSGRIRAVDKKARTLIGSNMR